MPRDVLCPQDVLSWLTFPCARARMSMYLPPCAFVSHDISRLIIFDRTEFTMRLEGGNEGSVTISLLRLHFDLFALSLENDI